MYSLFLSLFLAIPIAARYVGQHPYKQAALPALEEHFPTTGSATTSSSLSTSKAVSSLERFPTSSVPSETTTNLAQKRHAYSNCGNIKGVVFNGGMKPVMYENMTTATGWFTFQLTIPTSGPASACTTRDYIPMMAFARDVADAVNLVNGPNPPQWLLTFNEPDYSYMGWTPTMTPQQAADAIKPLLAQPGTQTKYVAPVLAFSDSAWLDQFFTACNCENFFSAYNIHQYHRTSQEVIMNVQNYHNRYSDKPLWLTEVAPGQANCQVGWDEAGQFMRDLYRFAKGSGWLQRVFWNTGNQLTNQDTNVCNSWLVDPNGNPGPLLKTFEEVDCT